MASRENIGVVCRHCQTLVGLELSLLWLAHLVHHDGLNCLGIDSSALKSALVCYYDCKHLVRVLHVLVVALALWILGGALTGRRFQRGHWRSRWLPGGRGRRHR